MIVFKKRAVDDTARFVFSLIKTLIFFDFCATILKSIFACAEDKNGTKRNLYKINIR